MRTTGELALHRSGSVLELRLNHPERLNAVTAGALDDLADLLEEVAEDDQVRVVVLTGEGRAFCSGADLSAEDLEVEGPGTETIIAANRAVRALCNLPQPTLAAVNGAVVGGGLFIGARVRPRGGG